MRDRIQAFSLISTVGKISISHKGCNNLVNFWQGRRMVLIYGVLNHNKWQIRRQIFVKLLDIKRPTSSFAHEMVSKQRLANGWIVEFSHVSFADFAPAIIFYSLQWNLLSEKEYFTIRILKKIKSPLDSAKNGVYLNSGNQKTLVYLIVGNEVSSSVTGREVLVSFHKQHSVVFWVKQTHYFSYLLTYILHGKESFSRS
jgi:hypothetical protein